MLGILAAETQVDDGDNDKDDETENEDDSDVDGNTIYETRQDQLLM